MSIHTESRRAAFGARFRGSVDVPGASPRPFAGLFDDAEFEASFYPRLRSYAEHWVALAAKGSVYPNWDADARPWPSPPYQVDQSFETAPLGVIGIRNGKCDRPREQKDVGEGFGVSEEAASPIGGVSKRSLKAQDMPGLVHSYDPVLDIYPRWEAGTFHVGFDIMAQPEAAWFFEMRVKGGEFAAGPYLRYQKGKLIANNSKICKRAPLACTRKAWDD